MNKKLSIIKIILILVFLAFISCQELPSILDNSDNVDLETNQGKGETAVTVSFSNKEDHEDEGDYTWENSSVSQVILNGSSIQSESEGVSINATTVTVIAYGNYEFTGNLSNGQIIVDVNEDIISGIDDLGKSAEINGDYVVRLILNGVNISSSSSSPIYIANSEKTIVVLNSNTENYISDGSNYVFENIEEDEPNAALFGKDDLTIFGDGSLVVTGNYNDGIASKDGLIIKSGNVSVTAVDDGIRGKDYVVLKGGRTVVDAGGEGIKSDNENDEASGYVLIENGTLNITSALDAITAQTDAIVTNGSITIKAGGGSSSYSSAISKKGIKGIENLIIDGGSFSINSADDAIHSNGTITINGGEFNISTGDDAIHADSTVEINDGSITVTKSYEGIESAVVIINDGTIKLTSSDDGLNVAGGNDGSGGRGGPGGFPSGGDYYLYINGGHTAIYAAGDGMDANGYIVMTGGDVIVHGPTAEHNSAIDYDGSFKITGGYLVAAGSSRMAQAPGSSSTQYSILLRSNTTRSAGSLFHIESSAGQDILTFKPVKNYQSIAFSSPSLSDGNTYKIYMGGSSTGTETEGLYSGGNYSGGNLYGSFTISNIVTTIN